MIVPSHPEKPLAASSEVTEIISIENNWAEGKEKIRQKNGKTSCELLIGRKKRLRLCVCIIHYRTSCKKFSPCKFAQNFYILPALPCLDELLTRTSWRGKLKVITNRIIYVFLLDFDFNFIVGRSKRWKSWADYLLFALDFSFHSEATVTNR